MSENLRMLILNQHDKLRFISFQNNVRLKSSSFNELKLLTQTYSRRPFGSKYIFDYENY